MVVAHRLSTIQNADVIYVLEEGGLAESGSHSQLMEQGGRYHQLVTLQQIAQEEGEDADTSGNNESQSTRLTFCVWGGDGLRSVIAGG